LNDKQSISIKKLSGGMKQRLALACAIVFKPDLILLDEPTVGLDPKQRVIMQELILSIARKNTILLSTHLLEDIKKLSNNIIILNKGELVFCGKKNDFEKLGNFFEKNIIKYMD
jgi:ABC-2 type transport system ATP-binding protein